MNILVFPFLLLLQAMIQWTSHTCISVHLYISDEQILRGWIPGLKNTYILAFDKRLPNGTPKRLYQFALSLAVILFFHCPAIWQAPQNGIILLYFAFPWLLMHLSICLMLILNNILCSFPIHALATIRICRSFFFIFCILIFYYICCKYFLQSEIWHCLWGDLLPRNFKLKVFFLKYS